MITEPASNAPYIFMNIVFVIILFSLTLFLLLMMWFANISLSMKNVFYIVNDTGIQVKGLFMYSKKIDKKYILKDNIKIINLNENEEYKLKYKTNGLSVPGYQAGIFRLRNKEKAYVYITDPTKVVYIPTKGEYSVMLSVTDAEDFIKVIKDM